MLACLRTHALAITCYTCTLLGAEWTSLSGTSSLAIDEKDKYIEKEGAQLQDATAGPARHTRVSFIHSPPCFQGVRWHMWRRGRHGSSLARRLTPSRSNEASGARTRSPCSHHLRSRPTGGAHDREPALEMFKIWGAVGGAESKQPITGHRAAEFTELPGFSNPGWT